MRQIRVNDQEFAIRVNLFDFFQVLRSRDAYRTKWLWIDQICIDQENVQERNEQVSVMDEIYRHAHETIVWLGSNPAPEPMTRLLATTWGEEGAVRQAEWEAFGRSCQAPYWSRHWIVQEILLSQNLTLWYGTCVTSWETFSHWAQGLHLYQGQADQTQLSTRAFNMLDNILARTDDSDFRRWVALTVHGSLSLCEDARDKVYAIQGLCHTSLRIDVDYGLAIKQVYSMAIAQCKDYLIAGGSQDEGSFSGKKRGFISGSNFAIRDFCRACFALAAAMALPVAPDLEVRSCRLYYVAQPADYSPGPDRPPCRGSS